MLTLTNISKTYSDGTKALNNISLALPQGMVGLLGPNGAGKTSLMRTIACLQQPDSGHAEFAGVNIFAQPHTIRSQLGYLPQYFGVYPNMSCRALLSHIATLKGLDENRKKQQIAQLLSLTHLTAFAEKKVAQFSGGMRQRFGIAQALLGDPRLIVMDEPTAGLDPMERESLNNLLVEISQDRLVLLSTHIVEDVENLCHHVAIINQGALIESGDIKQLLDPLNNKIWQLTKLPNSIPKTHVLSKSYRYGKSAYRVYADQAPCANAQLTQTRLQDKYSLELNKQGVPAC